MLSHNYVVSEKIINECKLGFSHFLSAANWWFWLTVGCDIKNINWEWFSCIIRFTELQSSPGEPPFYLEAEICLPNPDNAPPEKGFVPAVGFSPIPTLQPHSVNLLRWKKENSFKRNLPKFLRSRNDCSSLNELLVGKNKSHPFPVEMPEALHPQNLPLTAGKPKFGCRAYGLRDLAELF